VCGYHAILSIGFVVNPFVIRDKKMSLPLMETLAFHIIEGFEIEFPFSILFLTGSPTPS